MKHIGRIIRKIRNLQGRVLVEVALKANTSKSALSRIELGQAEVSDEKLCHIACALNSSEILRERCRGCAIGIQLDHFTAFKKAA